MNEIKLLLLLVKYELLFSIGFYNPKGYTQSEVVRAYVSKKLILLQEISLTMYRIRTLAGVKTFDEVKLTLRVLQQLQGDKT